MEERNDVVVNVCSSSSEYTSFMFLSFCNGTPAS